MIKLLNITKTYDKSINALSNVSISINDGEFVFVVGPSGAGKSTLTKLLLKEVSPTAGKIIVGGTDLSKIRRKEIAGYRRTLGVVFQDFRLIPTRNVFDNVAFALQVTGKSSRTVAARVPKVLSMLGIGDKSDRYPSELSGGEQQRVALARAIVNEPMFIIADEPTGNVDPQLSYEIVKLLTQINERGTTVIMVTHEHDLVKRFNHRVIILNDGKISADYPARSNGAASPRLGGELLGAR